jgi:hypothetical protein
MHVFLGFRPARIKKRKILAIKAKPEVSLLVMRTSIDGWFVIDGDAGGYEMVGLSSLISKRRDGTPVEQAVRGRERRAFLSAGARQGSISGRLSAIGMVLGYLGLVMILSTAPFWQQSIAPHLDQPLNCTDFGGSR